MLSQGGKSKVNHLTFNVSSAELLTGCRVHEFWYLNCNSVLSQKHKGYSTSEKFLLPLCCPCKLEIIMIDVNMWASLERPSHILCTGSTSLILLRSKGPLKPDCDPEGVLGILKTFLPSIYLVSIFIDLNCCGLG